MKIAPQKVAQLHYVLSDSHGEVLDDSRQRGEPLEYLHGHDNLMAGLERALEATEPGSRVDVTLAPDEAYGRRDESLVREVGRQAFPAAELRPGMCFQTPGDAGPQIVTVVEVKDTTVVIDTNHPLAGQTLRYQVEVLEVRDATRAELAKGHPLPAGTEASSVEDRKVL
ncbi:MULTISPECIES: FKBP-type peptidyl-prolyl cis-trans isomerase [Halomonas]|uniref:FKBP-type peptidyl-prolyl cis-trans isomerase n=1 Tax=Halomonas TaxID=2745 RepID=UPI001C96891E|nr:MULTISPECIES: peptidylprolyl isomerase [Halomonas]MBY6208142.1 peptidylprolyl isomerase [Halomonas sp. DP3Y7-2]MBY6228951.1 peptidylprolyl isomerase [Halomonas sp. DP3Y7-1]MCA0917065.1 peptidylprolyl isomerase [Halomonas denitrificans]